MPWDKIVKGYEYEDGNYVLLSEEELENASAEMTRTIEIEQFVDLEEIDVRYFDRPYMLVPDKNGEKGYVLLREAISDGGKAGIARVVIRARQYLAALVVEGDALVLELLRYAQELRPVRNSTCRAATCGSTRSPRRRSSWRRKLIDGMSDEWNAGEVSRRVPRCADEAHRAEDQDRGRPKRSKTSRRGSAEEAAPASINFMDVLKQSVAHASKPKRAATKRRPAKKTTGAAEAGGEEEAGELR